MDPSLVMLVKGDYYKAEYVPDLPPTDPYPHFTINGRLRTSREEIDSKLEITAKVYIGLSPYSLRSDASLVDIAKAQMVILNKAKNIATENPHPYYSIKENISSIRVPKQGMLPKLIRALGDVFGLGHYIEYAVNTQVQLLSEKIPNG